MRTSSSVTKRLAVALAALSIVSGAANAQDKAVEVDKNIPAYQPAPGVSGSLKSIGSDSMNNLMALWAEGFKKFYPNVTIEVEGKGSSTAPPALIAGTAQIGPMSRAMKNTEIAEFEKQFNYKPTEIRTALDALAVYVNKDNPVPSLSLPQVDAIFSKTRKGAYKEDIGTWGQVGLTGDWATKPISLYGRNSASGTYGYFKEHALYKGDFKDSVKEQPGSSSVVQGCTTDKYGIGYSGIGYKTSGVRAVPLAEKDGGPVFEASLENVYAGKYPLGRFLYVYVNVPPGKPLDPLVKEFVKFIQSREGQEVVIKDGYLPLVAKIVETERQKLETAQSKPPGPPPAASE